MDHVGESIPELLAGTNLVENLPEEMRHTAAAVLNSSVGLLSTALEGIEEGATDAGLPRPTAQAFVRQTMMTTALLLQTRGGSPADLKDQVASPGGTTIAGLAALEDCAVRGAFIRAVEAGTK
jgi:pyrroline-5-carboxylate reductase